ncbi:MAG: hypothetical protein BRC37_08420 [Cyanobacteria bacterium QH_3_48_40]|nr:MAG: hypothetical protein BRC37_08420 [Cyanobacteria bacterium QH_3_48_40]
MTRRRGGVLCRGPQVPRRGIDLLVFPLPLCPSAPLPCPLLPLPPLLPESSSALCVPASFFVTLSRSHALTPHFPQFHRFNNNDHGGLFSERTDRLAKMEIVLTPSN